MVVIEEKGYFEKGVWHKGIYNGSLVGKHVIRVRPFDDGTNLPDFTFCFFHKFGMNEGAWVDLREIRPDGSLVLVPEPLTKPDWVVVYPPEWNDGNWRELGDALMRKDDYLKAYYGKVIPLKPEGYTERLSGNWNDVPEWAVLRINFLEEQLERLEKRLAPHRHDKDCPDIGSVDPLTCSTVKHCYPYLCHGGCGHNEIHVTDEEKYILKILSDNDVSFNMGFAKHLADILPTVIFEFKYSKASKIPDVSRW